MYAIIKASGQQFKVAKGDLLTVDRLQADEGAAVDFSDVLLLGIREGEHERVFLGHPTIHGAKVTGEVVSHIRGEKIVVFRYKRRKNQRKKRGFRADLTQVRITGIHRADA